MGSAHRLVLQEMRFTLQVIDKLWAIILVVAGFFLIELHMRFIEGVGAVGILSKSVTRL